MVRKKRLRDHGGYSVAPARFQVSVIRQLPGTVLEKAAERLWLHPIFTCQLDKIRRKTSSGLLLVPLFCRRTAARRKGKTSLIPADKRGFFVGAAGGIRIIIEAAGGHFSVSPGDCGGYFVCPISREAQMQRVIRRRVLRSPPFPNPVSSPMHIYSPSPI